MEIEELEKGNLVMVDNEKHHPKLKGVPLMVTGFNPRVGVDGESTYSVSLEHINQEKNTFYESYSQFLKFIKPIPLDHDSLIKLGMEQTYNSKFRTRYDLLIDYRFGYEINKVYTNNPSGIRFFGNIAENLKYVHDFQNFYYWNSGKKELKFDF